MLDFGAPAAAIAQKMEVEGVEPALLQSFKEVLCIASEDDVAKKAAADAAAKAAVEGGGDDAEGKATEGGLVGGGKQGGRRRSMVNMRTLRWSTLDEEKAKKSIFGKASGPQDTGNSTTQSHW